MKSSMREIYPKFNFSLIGVLTIKDTYQCTTVEGHPHLKYEINKVRKPYVSEDTCFDSIDITLLFINNGEHTSLILIIHPKYIYISINHIMQ